MGKERIYPIGYKPKVCLADCNLKYYEKKYHKKLMDKNTFKAYEKFIKTEKIIDVIMLLDQNNTHPTEKQKQTVIRKCINKTNHKQNLDKYNYGIRDINIKHEMGVVNYEFDEFKH